MADTPTLFTTEQQATLNNIRAIVRRQLRPVSTVDPLKVADLILRHASMMREAGLAQELLEYLESLYYRLDEHTPHYAKVVIEMAATLDEVGGMRHEAEGLFRQALEFYAANRDELRVDFIHALLAYGQHLLARGQMEAAIISYEQALSLLDGDGPVDLEATAVYEMGRAYLSRGEFAAAIPQFERVLVALSSGAVETRTRVSVDLAGALIHQNDLERAATLLDDAFQTCETMGLWALRAQVSRQMAYADQVRAQSAPNKVEKKRLLAEAERRLNDAVEDLLPLRSTAELAVVYHDLGRLEGRLSKFDAAEEHVRLSSEMFSRLGRRRNFAVSQITLGQLVLLRNGDATAATERIRQALTMAGELQDAYTLKQAAESLIRIHTIQLKRTEADDIDIIRKEIAYTRARFKALLLEDYIPQLDTMLTELGE